jgi:hypothetical protein
MLAEACNNNTVTILAICQGPLSYSEYIMLIIPKLFYAWTRQGL